ncbi:PREDICTED: uncharacterized protein LOC109147025 [Ipomoea nil]|uniref:uncharacterized protein LOC109147025 n=1 Tax=Ipomoea nil TaxID=35883 RepID=UPI0009013BF5|nr:PREDICTED: uncharacterized protein LOC109147025 [Ipomoea nil]
MEIKYLIMINGFRAAVDDCGLHDVPFSGNQFTWVKSRGTDHMIEEKLDRVLVSDDWLILFEGVRVQSLVVPYSDHLPLLVTPVVLPGIRSRSRFCFDNMWLREDVWREIVVQSWTLSAGLDTISRIGMCATDIGRWRRQYNKDFQRRIDRCKRQMDRLCMRRDGNGMSGYAAAQKELLFLLEQQSLYWKKRAKEHWYKGVM